MTDPMFYVLLLAPIFFIGLSAYILSDFLNHKNKATEPKLPNADNTPQNITGVAYSQMTAGKPALKNSVPWPAVKKNIILALAAVLLIKVVYAEGITGAAFIAVAIIFGGWPLIILFALFYMAWRKHKTR